MCDEKKILMLLGGLDANVKTIIEQQGNIFERLGKLEQKSPVCREHAALVADIANLKTENKITSLVFAAIGTISILLIAYLAKEAIQRIIL